MSWSVFKASILTYASNPQLIDDSDTIAEIYAREYDSAVKRGTDFLNQTSIQRGNYSAMESLFKLAFKGGTLSTGPYDLIGALGRGVVLYWTGATMNQFPIPLIPAPGSIQNISVITNTVVNPGVWPVLPPTPPNNTPTLFIDSFILAATTHLSTISGIINTTSLYPSVPSPIPAPGVIPWTGYSVVG
jgi:hypothetical protein